MKTQLATLLLVFAHHGDAAHTIRGIENQNHSMQRNLKSGKNSSKDKDYGAYRVVGGKKGFNDHSGVISFEEDPPALWIVVKKGDRKVGQCASALAEWALETYNLDLFLVERDPGSRVGPDDILVFMPKKTDADDCNDMARDIAAAPGVSDRDRDILFNDVQNIAVFDISTEDKDCDRDCKKDKKDCEADAGEDEEKLRECKKDEDKCKRECEDDCEDDCDKYWPGLFNGQCRHAC
jgi:hypothetical protein